MAYKKVVVESAAGKITQEAASLLNQGALATLDSVAAGQIDANAVEASEIASGAVGYEELATDSVITAKIADSNVTNAKMADDAIGIAELSASGTAGATTFLRGDNSWVVPADSSSVANLSDTTITGTPANNEVLAWDGSSKWINQTLVEANIQVLLGSGDVTSSMIGQGTVALSNMANLAANTFIGRDTESTGVPEALSVSAVKTMLSLNNVTNTTDAGKPVSTAQQTEIDTKAELAGAAGQIFSATTASANTNTTQVATTAFVFAEAATKAELAGSSSQNFSTNDLSVTGDLNVTGTTNHVSTETLLIADNTMVLNSDKTGTADVDAGIVVERGTTGDFVNNKSLYWDEGSDKWKFATSTSVDVGGTYNGDVVSQYNTGTYDGSNDTVPVGHFQWDGTYLYVRTS